MSKKLQKIIIKETESLYNVRIVLHNSNIILNKIIIKSLLKSLRNNKQKFHLFLQILKKINE